MHYLTQLLQSETAPEITCENFPPACFTNFGDVGNIALPLIYGIGMILMLVYGIRAAFKYISAAGDAKALEESRKTLTFTIIGIFVIFLAYFMTRVIASLFHIEFLL